MCTQWKQSTEKEQLCSQEICNYSNIGDGNKGNRNVGDRNRGVCNVGGYNEGNFNTGDSNIGNRNTGDFNEGNYNTGNWNIGSRNTGEGNIGDDNAGKLNVGNRNVGSWNIGDGNIGFFNTKPQSIRIFNKITTVNVENIEFPSFLFFDFTEWVSESDATEKEKKLYQKEIKNTGGFLKKIEYKDAFRQAYNSASQEEHIQLFSLPNFDPAIFQEISGIDATEEYMQWKRTTIKETKDGI